MDQLGLRQRHAVIEHASWSAIGAIMNLAEKVGAIPVFALSSYYGHTPEALPGGLPWGKTITMHLCAIARDLAQRGLLDTHTLNILATNGRRVAGIVEGDDEAAEAVVHIAETISACAADMNARTTSGDGHFSAEAAKQLKSLEEWNKGRIARSSGALARVKAARAAVSALHFDRPHTSTWAPWPKLRDA
jgi:hypothetical protein